MPGELLHLFGYFREQQPCHLGRVGIVGELHHPPARRGEHATNCIFDGPALYVTATREADIEASARTGTFWRVDTDAPGGLELIPGRL